MMIILRFATLMLTVVFEIRSIEMPIRADRDDPRFTGCRESVVRVRQSVWSGDHSQHSIRHAVSPRLSLYC